MYIRLELDTIGLSTSIFEIFLIMRRENKQAPSEFTGYPWCTSLVLGSSGPARYAERTDEQPAYACRIHVARRLNVDLVSW